MYASINDPKITKTIYKKSPLGLSAKQSSALWVSSWQSSRLMQLVPFLIPLCCFPSCSFSSSHYLQFTCSFSSHKTPLPEIWLGNILKFLMLLHSDDLDDEADLLSPKQIKLFFFTVMRNLLGYFGVSLLSSELGKHLKFWCYRLSNMAL